MIVEMNEFSVSGKCCEWRGRLDVDRKTVPESRAGSSKRTIADSNKATQRVYALRAIRYGSVCLSVCHTPVYYRSGRTRYLAINA